MNGLAVEKSLEELLSDIRKRQEAIQDQDYLITVLEQEGYNMLEQKAALKLTREQLASEMAMQNKLQKAELEAKGR